MSVAEMKESLHAQIDNLTDEQLPVVQQFVEQVASKKDNGKPSMKEIWKELVEQYDSTLRRLAQ